VQVCERDGALVGIAEEFTAPVTEFFGEFLSVISVNLFRVRPPAPCAPRVLIDDLVICRAAWQVPAAEIPLPRTRPQDFTYQAAREWAAALGMPRHVFVRAPGEVKPVYVDFAAPALLDNMARLLRPVARHDGACVTFVEMLPAPGQLWLTDPAGRSYTAEIRIVAVDASGQRPDGIPLTPPGTGKAGQGVPG
jgi:hypothetical protein